MTSKQIWDQANTHRELIHSIYNSLCEDGNINDNMDHLKYLMPCLFGVDADRRALVFQSTDDGLVALMVREQDDTFVLALATGITLD
jgi:hypothetical protein